MDAEDALSRAMLKAFEKLPGFAKDIKDLRGWLTRLTHNTCMDIHRERAGREVAVESIEDVRPADAVNEIRADSPESAYSRHEQHEQLHRMINSLSPKLREPFILRFIHEMEYEEIAERLHLTPANVRKRIQQARKKLKEILNK